MNGSECTYPFTDLVRVDTSTGDVDITTLGFQPRGFVVEASGTLLARFTDTPTAAPDRVLAVRAGDQISAFIAVVRAGSTAVIHAGR